MPTRNFKMRAWRRVEDADRRVSTPQNCCASTLIKASKLVAFPLILSIILIFSGLSVNAQSSSVPPQPGPSAPSDVPVEVYQTQIHGNDARYGVRNDYTAPLTAYLIRGALGANIWNHAEDFRVDQAESVPAGQTRDDPAIWYSKSIPTGLKVVAAIFADGTSRGETVWVQTIMDKRKEEIWTYSTMSRKLSAMSDEHQPLSAVIDALKTDKATYVRNASRSKYVNEGGDQAYSAVMHSLTSSDVSKTMALISEATNRLGADAVKDPNGRLYLSDATTAEPSARGNAVSIPPAAPTAGNSQTTGGSGPAPDKAPKADTTAQPTGPPAGTSYKGPNAEWVHTVLATLGPFACDGSFHPKPPTTSSCQRDVKIYQAQMMAWSAECMAEHDQAERASGIAFALMVDLKAARELCGKAGEPPTCASDKILPCDQLPK
jgi:hypothetical protein